MHTSGLTFVLSLWGSFCAHLWNASFTTNAEIEAKGTEHSMQ